MRSLLRIFLFIILMSSLNSPVFAQAPGSLKCKFLADGQVGAPTIGADGTIYVPAGDNLYAMNPDCSPRWVFPLGGLAGDAAIADDGTIFVTASDAAGNIYAVNPDGTQKCAFATGGKDANFSPTIGADGTVYVARVILNKPEEGLLYSLDPKNCVPNKAPLAIQTQADAAATIGPDGTLYFPSWDGK